MPFSWFGGSSSTPASSSLSRSAPGAVVTRKVSLGNSSSGNGSLAEVRAKTKSSYMRKEMAQSGELSSSRGRRSAHNRSAHLSRSAHTPVMRKHQAIVAVEPDIDDSKHRRIDQGLLDASREAQNHVLVPPNKSWWAGFSSTVPPTAPVPTHVRASSNPSVNEGASTPGKATHRRTISYNKTYRVP